MEGDDFGHRTPALGVILNFRCLCVQHVNTVRSGGRNKDDSWVLWGCHGSLTSFCKFLELKFGSGRPHLSEYGRSH